jgi:hypothetical protein
VGVGKVTYRGVRYLRNDKNKREKSKIDTDDGWNRTFYGSPTIGGIIIVGAVVLYLLFK